jgi:hypothetical protein
MQFGYVLVLKRGVHFLICVSRINRYPSTDALSMAKKVFNLLQNNSGPLGELQLVLTSRSIPTSIWIASQTPLVHIVFGKDHNGASGVISNFYQDFQRISGRVALG